MLERFLLDRHEELLRLYEPDRAGHDSDVLGAVVVSHDVRRPPAPLTACAAHHQWCRRSGRRLGKREDGGEPGPCKATTRGIASTSHSCCTGGRTGWRSELYPNDPNSMFTVDNIDWSQIPPDNNTGIQFPIQLHVSGPLALSNAHVVEHNAANLSSSALTVKGDITNVSSKRQTGRVSAVVSSPGGSATARLGRRITLAPGASRAVALPFRIHHPRVWWPYRMGGQPLYGLKLAVFQRRAANNSESETFGIRTITTRLVGPAPIAPHGSRQFLVNGKPFMFRGAAWSEDLLLRYSSADISTQIALIKNLGLNGIRTEGKQMPDDFYERMDRAGVLIDGGFQCCDAWQLPGNGQGVTSRDYFLLYLSARTIGENLRNHPSVMDFSWSDNNPTPQQEAVSLRGFRQADFPDPLIASAQYKSSVQLGPSGEKEGPSDLGAAELLVQQDSLGSR